jgi:hypothetical protein
VDWLTFVSKLVDALAWPAVVLILAFSFRDKISQLFRLVSKLKAGPVEAEFSREVQELRKDAESGVQAALSAAALPHQQRLLKLAESSPRAAIIEAWQLVEFASQDLLERRNVRLSRSDAVSPLRLGRALSEVGGLSAADLTLFNELRSLRNAAVHAKGFDPSAEATTNYVELAVRLYETIRALNVMLPAG